MEKKFSYAEDFQNVAEICKVGNDFEEFSHYVILVGDPDAEFTFLDLGKAISAEPFTTYTDASRALSLVRRVLEIVDENFSYGLKLSDVRDEILAKINRNTNDRLIHKHDATRAVNSVCNYYIEHGA